MQSFYQNTFTAPIEVVKLMKKAKSKYIDDEYKTIRSIMRMLYEVNSKGQYEDFSDGYIKSNLYYGKLLSWLDVDDDEVDDQDDYYENQPRQSYNEKVAYREWCFYKYLFGEINVIGESK